MGLRFNVCFVLDLLNPHSNIVKKHYLSVLSDELSIIKMDWLQLVPSNSSKRFWRMVISELCRYDGMLWKYVCWNELSNLDWCSISRITKDILSAQIPLSSGNALIFRKMPGNSFVRFTKKMVDATNDKIIWSRWTCSMPVSKWQ